MNVSDSVASWLQQTQEAKVLGSSPCFLHLLCINYLWITPVLKQQRGAGVQIYPCAYQWVVLGVYCLAHEASASEVPNSLVTSGNSAFQVPLGEPGTYVLDIVSPNIVV